MTYQPRIIVDDIGVYHITVRGNNRQAVFLDEGDFLRFKEIIEKYESEFGFKLYHYALLPNHVHLMLDVKESKESLSNVMHRINLSYSWYHKKKYDRFGHLWEKSFGSRIVTDERYYWLCGSYIDLNATKHKLTQDPRSYAWSSYGRLAVGTPDSILSPSILYQELGRDDQERQNCYAAMLSLRSFDEEAPSPL